MSQDEYQPVEAPEAEPVDMTAAPQDEEKPRADFLPGREPEAEDVPFSEVVHPIIVRVGCGAIGQTVFTRGDVLAEIRLATGVTLAQVLAAVRNGTAGESQADP